MLDVEYPISEAYLTAIKPLEFAVSRELDSIRVCRD